MNLWCLLQCRIFSPIIVVPVVTVTSLGLFLRGFPLVTVSSKNTQSAFDNFKRFSLSHLLCVLFGVLITACKLCGNRTTDADSVDPLTASQSGIILFFFSSIYDGDCLDILNLNFFFYVHLAVS